MTRILCLDDDHEFTDLLRLILTRAGYEVVITNDEEQALSILRTQPPDLFTQDFLRPGMGGWVFLRMLRADAALRDIPVLGISAGPRDMRARQLESMGLDIDRDLAGYLTKPASPIEVLDVVEAALQRHSLPIPVQAAQFREQYQQRMVFTNPRIHR